MLKRAASSSPTLNLSLVDTPAGLVLADEVLTPDSSRFWPIDKYKAGRPAGIVRQAVRARLPGIDQVEQAAAGSGIASGGGGKDQ